MNGCEPSVLSQSVWQFLCYKSSVFYVLFEMCLKYINDIWIFKRQHTKMYKWCCVTKLSVCLQREEQSWLCNSPVPEPTMSLLGDSDIASASLSLKPSSVASTEDMWRKPKLSGQLPHTSSRVTLWSNVPERERDREKLDTLNMCISAICCEYISQCCFSAFLWQVWHRNRKKTFNNELTDPSQDGIVPTS